MKLLLFVHNFPPEFLGGTELVVRALAKAYQAAGDEVVVVAGSERRAAGGARLDEQLDGLRVVRLLRDQGESYGLDLGFARTGERVTDLLVEERPDAVHVHHWVTLGWDLLRRAAALGIPGGATLHDLWTTCPRFFRRPPSGVRCPELADREPCAGCVAHDLKGPSTDQLRAAIARRDAAIRDELRLATFLAAPSQAAARFIELHLPWPSALEVVPHGLLEPVTERSQPRAPGKPLRVGSFGNIVPEKGIDLLVEALTGCGEEIELRLSGHAPDPAYVQRLGARAKELGIPFVWTGPYGVHDPHPALQLDLAVFPSLCQETYGLVVEEALARGVPVVVSARGALPERAQRGGVVVRSGGVMPLKVSLANLLRSRRRLLALREAIPRQFATIEQAAARYRALLTSQAAAR